ncbi:MAG: imm11 family protein [Ignavibacteriales bacterium]
MKWYQPIECDNTVKNPLVCDFDNLEQFGYNGNNFKEGELVDWWNDSILLQAKKKKNDGKPDDALQNHLMLPIYSFNLITEINKAAISGIQYLPIKILKSNNECLDGFSIVNILNFIEAFNEQKSEFNRFSEDFPNPNVRGKIAGVKKYVLQKEKLIGFDIIRLKEYKQRFFVSEKFKDIFEKNKFTGYSFKEVELV